MCWDSCGGQKRISYSPELKIQEAVSCLVWVQSSTARATNALNQWAIFPSPFPQLNKPAFNMVILTIIQGVCKHCSDDDRISVTVADTPPSYHVGLQWRHSLKGQPPDGVEGEILPQGLLYSHQEEWVHPASPSSTHGGGQRVQITAGKEPDVINSRGFPSWPFWARRITLVGKSRMTAHMPPAHLAPCQRGCLLRVSVCVYTHVYTCMCVFAYIHSWSRYLAGFKDR